MPITFAHPAAILPFARLRRESGWFGCLLAGSVVPDVLQSFFGYSNRFPHSALGSVILDTPAAIALAWIAHTCIGTRLRRMPGLESIHPITRFAWSWAPIAAFVGVSGHLVLDLFTHTESPLAQSGILAEPVAGTEWNLFTVASLLWYVGSICGSAAMAVWLARRARRVPGGPKQFLSWRWVVVATATCIPIVPAAVAAMRLYTPDLLEFFGNLGALNRMVRWSLFGSAVAGTAAFFAVTRHPHATSEPANPE